MQHLIILFKVPYPDIILRSPLPAFQGQELKQNLWESDIFTQCHAGVQQLPLPLSGVAQSGCPALSCTPTGVKPSTDVAISRANFLQGPSQLDHL